MQKNSKFEGETRSNGIPLVQHGIFFFFHKNFSTYIQKDSLQFFLMLCSYFQNNECKKSRNSIGTTRAMESHFYSMDFFSFTRIFLHTFRKIPYNFFLCCVRISRIMNAKNLEVREGRQEQWNPTSTAWNFFFLSREFVSIHSEIFLTIFFYAVFAFPE